MAAHGFVTSPGQVCHPVKRKFALFQPSLKPFFAAVFALTFLVQIVAPAEALAAKNYTRGWSKSKQAVLVYDVTAGKTLYSYRAKSKRYPASLTKMMTLYVLFDQMKKGKFNLNSRLKVSRRAAGQPASKLGLRAGKSIKVKDAIPALVIRSANDVATVVAEAISGSEKKFARLMTKTARRLGMRNTSFRNASGLPNKNQKSTAQDFLKLSMALMNDFPKEYKYFNKTKFVHNGRRINTHNRLIKMKGVDGIKTGYTRASGFNLISSMHRGNRHIIAVVMGGPSSRSRDTYMRHLLNTYINKASSRKPRKNSWGRSAPLLVASFPQPRPKPGTKSIIEVEVVESAPEPRRTPAAPSPAKPEPVVVEPKLAKSTPQADEPGLAQHSKPTAAPSLAKLLEPKIITEKTAIASITANRNWGVQIGTSDTQEGAKRLLSSAWEKGRDGKLKIADPVVEKVKRRGSTFFRSRFIQLSQTDADKACVGLKSKKVDCYIFRMRE